VHHCDSWRIKNQLDVTCFISVINQLDAQNFCFTGSLFHASTCFENMCSSSGGQNCITQPLVWWHQRLCNAILTSWWWVHVLETCRGRKWTYCKTKILCIKLVNCWDKYTEMHGQRNVKNRCHLFCLLYFLDTQHVSGINMSIFRNLRLYCWNTTLVVLFLDCCVLELGCGSAWVVSRLPTEAQVVLQSASRIPP